MAYISHTARYLPPREVHNSDLVQFPKELRDAIAAKAGIHSRRVADGECTSDVGANAVRLLLQKSGIECSAISGLVCATSSPDRMQPATATRIQELCGLRGAFAFDVNSVCSGAIYALRLASALVNDGLRNIVVVGAEVYSKILNPNDLSTYPYFGDGAGACLVSSTGLYKLSDFELHSDGSGADVIQVPAGGTMLPAAAVEEQRDFYFRMIGRKVFEFATRRGSELVTAMSARNNLIPDKIVLHQANLNVIREIATRSNFAFDRFFVNVDRYANTAGASILIALDELLESGACPNTVLMCAFGGGLSWGGSLLVRAGLDN